MSLTGRDGSTPFSRTRKPPLLGGFCVAGLLVENSLDGCVLPFDRLKGSQCRFDPIIGETIQNYVGLLASSHG